MLFIYRGGSISFREAGAAEFFTRLRSDTLGEGKGLGYERWTKIFNLKQMAATLQFLQKKVLLQYEDLERRAARAVDRSHALTDKIKATEVAMARNNELKGAIVDNAKTRPLFDAYKAARYSRKCLAEHEADIQLHRAARATFDHLLGGWQAPHRWTRRKRSTRHCRTRNAPPAENTDMKHDLLLNVSVLHN